MWPHILALSCVVYSSCGEIVSRGAQTLISTPVGTIGGIDETFTVYGSPMTVRKFLGIPYAESPTGNNRFQKPVPKAAFPGVFNATTDPPACFQGPFINETSARQTEDCLMLNVYVPERHSMHSLRLPVMVWVHGGAFLTGTSSEYHFEYLSLFSGVIVVTINYRLAEFGFLRSTDGRLIGNQGLWDQHLAFKWVNKNIASFHGDPHQVTIFGESAGSVSVTLQAMYAGNKGLFQRVIGESGSAMSERGAMSANSGDQLVQVTGCGRGGDDAVQCLRTMAAGDLHTHAKATSLYTYGSSFVPVVDGDFFVETPHAIIYGNSSVSKPARDFFASLDILTGVNNKDGAINFMDWPKILHRDINNLNVSKEEFESILTAMIKSRFHSDQRVDNATLSELIQATIFEYTDWSDLKNNSKRVDMMIKLSCDLIFFVSSVKLANGHSRMHNGRTYFYEFIADTTYHILPTPTTFHGANHADELRYLLGLPFTYPNYYTADDRRLSHSLMTMWSNFARSGDPNMPVNVTGQPFSPWTTWPLYDMANQKYLQIDYYMTQESVKQHFNARSQAFWTYLVPSIIKYTSSTVRPTSQFNPNVDIVG